MKLVRDRIPEIAPHRKFRQVTAEELASYVMDKITEEAQEVIGAASPVHYNRDTNIPLIEELADLHQVMLKLAEISGISWDEVLASARGKNAAKGKFDGNWVLDENT